jgi:hypothetical protein
VGIALIILLFKLILQDWHKAGLLTTLAALLFFFYGHVFLFLSENLESIAHHRCVVAFFIGIFLLGMWWVVRWLGNPQSLERFLTITGITLVAFSLLQLAWYEYSVYRASSEADARVESGIDFESYQNTDDLPDVYWIILDAYGRSDVLEEYYDYDNAEFLGRLEEMGFYVAACSQTNYPDTILSVLSTMNMDYLQNVVSGSGAFPQLNKSVVRKNFNSLGYRTVTFENYFRDHFDLFEDLLLTRPQLFTLSNLFKGANEFETMLMQTTLLKLFVDMPHLIPSFLGAGEEDSWYYDLYLQTQYVFDTLPTLPAMEGPNFFFIHLIVPHTPYIFTPDGGFLLTENTDVHAEMIGYRNNVAFVDNHLPDVLQAVIDNSETPPIIIVQGDHGPTSRDVHPKKRMPILNAYYFPGGGAEDLYQHVTPVNSFRVLFNHYFAADYPYLEDLSYYVWGKGIGDFPDDKIFPNQCKLDE